MFLDDGDLMLHAALAALGGRGLKAKRLVRMLEPSAASPCRRSGFLACCATRR